MKRIFLFVCLSFASIMWCSGKYVYLPECEVKESLLSILDDIAQQCDSIFKRDFEKGRVKNFHLEVHFIDNGKLMEIQPDFNSPELIPMVCGKLTGYITIRDKTVIFFGKNPCVKVLKKQRKKRYFVHSHPQRLILYIHGYIPLKDAISNIFIRRKDGNSSYNIEWCQ